MASRPSILVVGSINMDLVLQTERVPLAGESFFGKDYRYVPGGKGANQAVAAARLGADVTFVGRVGDDAHGPALRAGHEREGIATELLRTDPDRPSGLAIILLEAGGENRIIVYSGANMAIAADDVARAFEAPYDAALINFEIPPDIVLEVCRLGRDKGVPVVLDAGPAQPFDLAQVKGLEILSPNETETAALTGMPCGTPAEAEAAATALAEVSEAKCVVIKMGEQGALLYTRGRAEFFPARTIEAVDTTAAGDAFTAALALHVLQHGDLRAAVPYANVAGALACTRLGAQPSLPTAAEVERVLS